MRPESRSRSVHSSGTPRPHMYNSSIQEKQNLVHTVFWWIIHRIPAYNKATPSERECGGCGTSYGTTNLSRTAQWRCHAWSWVNRNSKTGTKRIVTKWRTWPSPSEAESNGRICNHSPSELMFIRNAQSQAKKGRLKLPLILWKNTSGPERCSFVPAFFRKSFICVTHMPVLFYISLFIRKEGTKEQMIRNPVVTVFWCPYLSEKSRDIVGTFRAKQEHFLWFLLEFMQVEAYVLELWPAKSAQKGTFRGQNRNISSEIGTNRLKKEQSRNTI